VTDAGPPLPRAVWIRLGTLVLATVTLLVLAKATGLTEHLHVPELRARMARAGWWGPVIYIAAFTVGELLHVPGTLFIAAAVLSYGRAWGTPLAFVGAVVSFSVCFVVVRAVGGRALGTIPWRFARRILAHLDEHPIRTVIALRLVLWLTPQLNYVLALSNISFRSYFVGSTTGLAIPVVVLAYGLDYFLR
jgi:uncharacterized membrane protein YdjX (TVP38/TMEM64 family)